VIRVVTKGDICKKWRHSVGIAYEIWHHPRPLLNGAEKFIPAEFIACQWLMDAIGQNAMSWPAHCYLFAKANPSS
jgi:hypothetical protein